MNEKALKKIIAAILELRSYLAPQDHRAVALTFYIKLHGYPVVPSRVSFMQMCGVEVPD